MTTEFMPSDELEATYLAIGKMLGLDKLGGYLYWWTDGLHYVVPGETPKYYSWLDDDGDAFRLAVDLNIQLMTEGDVGSAGALIKWPNGTQTCLGIPYEGQQPDKKYVAARKVIVFAAEYIHTNGYLYRK